MKSNPNKLEKIQITQQEIWMHTRHTVQKNKKKYNRKNKYKLIKNNELFL